MTLLQDITAAALLGTERQPFAPPAAPGDLGALLARLPADSEAALLGAAAAVALGQRAGTLPIIVQTARPEPCPADSQPVCSPRAAQGFSVMLGGRHREALPEMLSALALTGGRVPETLLPELLKAGRQQKELRPAILPVIGFRGRWLAAQNRDWAFADQLLLETAESPEQVWAEGSREARLSALLGLRQTNPAQALSLLQTTWAAETADDRAAFLAALATGLSLADEPFLEAALDDRGKEVRRVAADLLARLLESAFVRRMIARAEPLLVGKRSLLGGFSLEVTLPGECDKSMERDGIVLKPSDRNMGDKAWWLCQMVGSIPLGHWTQTWQRKPKEILEAASKTVWEIALRRGWETAAQRQPDIDWVEALLYLVKDQSDRHHLNAILSGWSALPVSRREKMILETLRPQAHLFGTREAVPLHDGHPALPLLQSHTQPWSAELTRTVVENIQRRASVATGKDEHIWQIPHALKRYAYFMPPNLADEFSQGWPADDTPQWQFWQPHVHEFLTTLQFRHDLLKEIRLMTELLREHAEQQFADELAALAQADTRPRPHHWKLSPWAVAQYLLGGRLDNGFEITPKYVGQRRDCGDRRLHPRHRPRPASAGVARHGQNVGVRASVRRHFRRLNAAHSRHGGNQRGVAFAMAGTTPACWPKGLPIRPWFPAR